MMYHMSYDTVQQMTVLGMQTALCKGLTRMPQMVHATLGCCFSNDVTLVH